MSAFDTRAGQDFVSLVPDLLQDIVRQLKRANDLKESELKLMQEQMNAAAGEQKPEGKAEELPNPWLD